MGLAGTVEVFDCPFIMHTLETEVKGESRAFTVSGIWLSESFTCIDFIFVLSGCFLDQGGMINNNRNNKTVNICVCT